MSTHRLSGTPAAYQIRILLVEDSVKEAARVRCMLDESPLANHCTLEHVNRLSEALRSERCGDCDVVLLDMDLPDSKGLETVFKFNREVPELPVVVFASLAQKRLAAAAVPLWAQDYVLKEDGGGLSLANILRRAIESYQQSRRLFCPDLKGDQNRYHDV